MQETRYYWIYILNCVNGNFYTGYTTDLLRRFDEHCLGTAKCKYTRSFKPISIAQYWQIQGDLSLAMRIEAFIKKRSKKEKIQLIASPRRLLKNFDCILVNTLSAI